MIKCISDFGNFFLSADIISLVSLPNFDINKRTKFDASISSGLAIMACQRHLYASKSTREIKKIDFGFSRYNNAGSNSKIIQ